MYKLPENKQIERLPKWAQEHIKRLENKLNRKEEDIQNLTQMKETKVHWNAEFSSPDVYIPDDAEVTFHLKNGNIEISISQFGYLNVLSSKRLCMFPDASNSIKITVEEL